MLEQRGAERVRLAGYSAGAAYALATAQRLGERVAGVGLIAPLVPLGIARALPGAGLPLSLSGASATVLARRIPALRRGIDAWTRRSRDYRGLPDASADAFLHSLTGALTRGPWPTIADLGLVLLREWGFDPGAIACGNVVIWQGRRDWQVPWPGTARLAERIPGAVLHLDPTANHHSVLTRHVDELLLELRATDPR